MNIEHTINIEDFINRLYFMFSSILNSNIYAQHLQGELKNKIPLFEIGGKLYVAPYHAEKVMQELSQSEGKPFLFIFGNAITEIDIFGKKVLSFIFEYVQEEDVREMIENFLENYKEVFIYNSRVWYLPVYQLIFRKKDYSTILKAPIEFLQLYYSEEENQSEEFLVHVALLDFDNLTTELLYSSGNHSEIVNISHIVKYLISENSEKQTLGGDSEIKEDYDEEEDISKIKSKKPRATLTLPKIPPSIKIEYLSNSPISSIEKYIPKHF